MLFPARAAAGERAGRVLCGPHTLGAPGTGGGPRASGLGALAWQWVGESTDGMSEAVSTPRFPQSPGNQQVQPHHRHLLPARRKDPEGEAGERNPDQVREPQQH